MIAAEPKTAGQYQPYPEYKDSGVEWLGEVPTNWSVATLRHALVGIKNGSTATQLDEGIDTVQISRIETISTGEINHDKVGFVEFVDALHHYRLNVGDILFSHINSLPMVGNIAQYCSKIPLYHGMNLLRLQPSAKVESRYLYWWLKSTFSRQSVESLAKPAINQASIAIDQIKSIPCLYPMWDEQCIIAAFLDYETARIDRLITQQQRLIELLKEKRQAVISHAVTKGLNPEAPMKDSGIEWLGQVPKHWKVGSLRWYLRVSSGEYLSNQHFDLEPSESAIYPVIGGNGVMGYTSHKNQATPLVVGRVGALCGNVHLVDGECWVTDNALLIGLSSKISVNFAAHYLKSLNLNKLANQNTQPLITGTMIKDQNIALPPLHEQSEIVEFVTQEEQKLNLLVAKAEQAIVLMQERRTALIAAAVTGKIDLRGWTTPADEVAV
ncbi:restriction endonuclease subunit S [Aeromonas caviae]|uniref:restriction endonuclease subunit S n=1 Tax=Aeromonas caviae TaxID=648 RepID=UPI001BCDAFDF|nr:restriction endonuclease subunit S [Aeromonas caviae]MBS4710885.1 restriction endonuclease subunit S [Aeromonas caviae]